MITKFEFKVALPLEKLNLKNEVYSYFNNLVKDKLNHAST